jgi:hypothetical protein
MAETSKRNSILSQIYLGIIPKYYVITPILNCLWLIRRIEKNFPFKIFISRGSSLSSKWIPFTASSIWSNLEVLYIFKL